jgi:hypothetical protein
MNVLLNSLFDVVDEAVEAAHNAVMFNTGQVCTAGSRTYVHESIYEDFIRRSAERCASRTTGDPFDARIENGPQVKYCLIIGHVRCGRYNIGLSVANCSISSSSKFFETDLNPTDMKIKRGLITR